MLSAMLSDQPKSISAIETDEKDPQIIIYDKDKATFSVNCVIVNDWKDKVLLDDHNIYFPLKSVPESPALLLVGRSDYGYFYSINDGALICATDIEMNGIKCLSVPAVMCRFYDTTLFLKRFI